MNDVCVIPHTYVESDGSVVPWVNILIYDLFHCSKLASHERDFEVLTYRYGLGGQAILTLEEVGIIYGVSRERSRQIEGKAKKLIRRLLDDGRLEDRNINVLIHPKYYERLKEFRLSLNQFSSIESEQKLAEHASEFFGVINLDIPAMRLLFEIYSFKCIDLSRRNTGAAWVLGNIDTKHVQRLIDACFKYLRDAVIPKPLDDILINANRRLRGQRITRNDLERAMTLSLDIEFVESSSYQVRYELLTSIADKIYRFLHAHGEPMHIRDIARRANSEAFRHGEKLRMNSHNVGNRLSADGRFVSIGRSGEWALKDWDIETDNVLSLMRDALHASGNALTSDQIFQYVSTQRPVNKTSITSYLSNEDKFIRVGRNLFALSNWGMQSVSKRHINPRKRVLSKAKLSENIELTFMDLDVSEMYVSDLAKSVANLEDDLHQNGVYMSILKSPAVRIEDRVEGKRKRKIAIYNPKYRSLLSKTDILTKDIPMRQLIQNTVREALRNAPDQTMIMAILKDMVVAKLSCPKASVYGAISTMDDVCKTKSRNGKMLCTLEEQSDRYMPIVGRIADKSIKAEIERALHMLHLDTIDVALFQLGKIFEDSLSHYMYAVEANGQIPVTSKDKKRLFNMVNWAESNGLVADTAAPHYLRVERNDRAHGAIPDLDEREAMLATSNEIVRFYLEYIVLFRTRIEDLK